MKICFYLVSIISSMQLYSTDLFLQKPLPITLSKDGFPMLEGQALTVSDLYSLIHSPEIRLKELEEKIIRFSGKGFDEKNTLQVNYLNILKEQRSWFEDALCSIRPFLWWWQEIPALGIRLEEPFWPIHYPYLPHAFALWQLAPHLGKGQEVFLIDTGIAAFNLDNKEFYKKHQDLEMIADFSKQRYNFVAHTKDILDPFEQLVSMIMEYTNHTKENEHRIRICLPEWIQEHAVHSKAQSIAEYLCIHGKPSLWHETNCHRVLTQEGKRALREILQGEVGIHPKHHKHHIFTSVNLYEPNNQQNVLLEFIPTAPIFQTSLSDMDCEKKKDAYFSASYESGHGSHSSGIIGARLHSKIDGNNDQLSCDHIKELLQKDSGMCGIAPHCHLMMLKALRSNGDLTDRQTITRAIEHARRMNAKILNLSLKVDDKLDITAPDVIAMKTALEGIAYPVACSGNATNSENESLESYPAKFSCIPFDVGAFNFYKDEKGLYHCSILPISQYQKDIGPKFVMPGYNILSCGLTPNQKEDSMYVFMRGTSAAAPMISGFLALVLAEFEGEFGDKEREIILKVCYTSGMKMENTSEWQEKTLLGVLDMRTALFVLHCLKKIKATLNKKSTLQKKYPFDRYYNHYIRALHLMLESMVTSFSKKHCIKANFKDAFIDFFNETLPNRSKTLVNRKIFTSLESALEYINDSLCVILENNNETATEFVKNGAAHAIKELFKRDSCDLFENFKSSTQKRLELVFR